MNLQRANGREVDLRNHTDGLTLEIFFERCLLPVVALTVGLYGGSPARYSVLQEFCLWNKTYGDRPRTKACNGVDVHFHL